MMTPEEKAHADDMKVIDEIFAPPAWEDCAICGDLMPVGVRCLEGCDDDD